MRLDDFEFRVMKLILEEKLLPSRSKVLVALSGGVDSMALLNVLLNLSERLNIEIEAAHFNHKIRSESDLDERFVLQYCRQKGVPLHIGRGDVPQYCKKMKMGIEEGARKLRYDFLNSILKEARCDFLALAHNLDDLMETMIHRIIRGTSPLGMISMKLKQDRKIRPLLYVRREEIEEYVKRCEIPFVQDLTNFDIKYTRNFIRIKVIPLLRKINPRVHEAFLSLNLSTKMLAEHTASQLEKRYKDTIKILGNRIVFETGNLSSFEIAEFIKSAGSYWGVTVNNSQLSSVFKNLKSGSWKLKLGKNVWLRKSLGFMCVEKKTPFTEKMILNREGIYEMNLWKFAVSSSRLSLHYIVVPRNMLENGLVLRTRRAGDRIGGEKLKDLFISARIPEFFRDDFPLLCYRSEILWVPYVYISNRHSYNELDTVVINLLESPISCILKEERFERRKKF